MRKNPISHRGKCEIAPLNGEKSSFRFKREERLKGRDKIREVFSKGRSFSCTGTKLFVLKNNLPYNRICFSLSRGFPNAVLRNRARRLGRETYRLVKPQLLTGYDLILLVYVTSDRNKKIKGQQNDRPKTEGQPGSIIRKQLELATYKKQFLSLSTRAGLLK